jgi:lipoprotein-releasing system permease protein
LNILFNRFEKTIAYRYLRSPRQEGFISIIAWFSFIGIALGVATLIIVMSVMNGFREELLTRIIGLNGHIAVTAIGGNLANYDEAVKQIQGVEGVKQVYPNIDRQAMVLYRSQARGIQVNGVYPEDLKKRAIIASNIKAGTLESFGRVDPGVELSDTIAVGQRFSDKLGVRVGDKITLLSPEGNTTAFGTLPRQKTFRVVAIFEVGMNEYDQAYVFMPLTTAQNFFRIGEAVTNLEVFIDNPDQVSTRGRAIHQLLGDQAHVYDWQNANNSLFQAVKVERNVMFIILTLIILIAAFNIISSLIMLVKDKTRDIAIMRTMGATQGNILRVFFLTGATIGVVGTVLGVTLGLSIALNIESIRKFLEQFTGTDLFNAEIYFLTQLPSKVEVFDVLTVVGMSLFLSFLATIYPAWRAARLDPVEALRQ